MAVGALVVHGAVMAAHGPSMADHTLLAASMDGDGASLPEFLSFASCFAIVAIAVARLASQRRPAAGFGIVAAPTHPLAVAARPPARSGRHPPDDGTTLRL